MITFSVSALEKNPVRKSGVLPAEFLDLAPEDSFAAAGEVTYDVTAALVSGGVLVSGELSVPLTTVCGRCLKEIGFTLSSGEIQLFFEIDDSTEELETGEELRAELLLALPMNPLCSEQCRGLCPECGCDLNESSCDCDVSSAAGAVSPWSALDDLKL